MSGCCQMATRERMILQFDRVTRQVTNTLRHRLSWQSYVCTTSVPTGNRHSSRQIFFEFKSRAGQAVNDWLILEGGVAHPAIDVRRDRRRRVHQHDCRADIAGKTVINLRCVVAGYDAGGKKPIEQTSAGPGEFVDRQPSACHLRMDRQQARSGGGFQNTVILNNSGSDRSNKAKTGGRRELLQRRALLRSPALRGQECCATPRICAAFVTVETHGSSLRRQMSRGRGPTSPSGRNSNNPLSWEVTDGEQNKLKAAKPEQNPDPDGESRAFCDRIACTPSGAVPGIFWAEIIKFLKTTKPGAGARVLGLGFENGRDGMAKPPCHMVSYSAAMR